MEVHEDGEEDDDCDIAKTEYWGWVTGRQRRLKCEFKFEVRVKVD